jgi:hypothetical protein
MDPVRPRSPPHLIPSTLDKRPNPLETLETGLAIDDLDLVDLHTREDMLVDLEVDFERR